MADHIDAYVRLAQLERLVPQPGFPTMAEIVSEIDRDVDSYVAALEEFARNGHYDEALKIAVRLAPYWTARGLFTEGRTQLKQLLGDASPTGTLRAQALETAATLALEQGANAEARALFEESLAAAADDEVAKASAHRGLARSALMESDLDAAREHARACEAILRVRGDELALDSPLHILAYADYVAGDDERARAGFEETLALNRRLGNRRAIARELTNLGSVETRAGNLERAQELCDEALRMAVELDNSTLITYCVVNVAGVASARGDHERAARLLGAGERMLEAAGMTLNPGTAIEYARHVERTRAVLGDAEYERLNRAGRELDRDAAIDDALSGA